MFTARIVRVVAGKAGYTASCLLAAVVLVVSGYAHKTVSQVSGFANGASLGGGVSVAADCELSRAGADVWRRDGLLSLLMSALASWSEES